MVTESISKFITDESTVVDEVDVELMEGEVLSLSNSYGDISSELDTLSDNLTSLEQGLKSFESFTEGMLETVGDDDWDRYTANKYYTGAKAVLTASGIPVESALGDYSFEAVEATETGGENKEKIKEKAGEFKKKVVEAIKAVIARATELYNNLVDKAASIANKLEAIGSGLESKITSLDFDKPIDIDGSPAWAGYLYIDDNLVSPPHQSLTKSRAAVKDFNENWSSAIKGASADLLSGKEPTSIFSNNKVFEKMDLSGNVSITLTREGESVNTLKIVTDKKPIPTGQKVRTLSKQGAEVMAKAIKDTGVELGKSTAKLKTVSDELKKLSNAKDLDKTKSDNIRKLVTISGDIQRKLMEELLSSAKNAVKHITTTLRMNKPTNNNETKEGE